MNTSRLLRRTGLGLLAAGLALSLPLAPAATADKNPRVQVGPYQLSGPYTHENLTLFLIHGQDQLKGKTFLTLQEAIEQKKVIVHETRNVNQLSIENVSPDAEIFVQSGDIVKGGQQDRTIAHDLIVPPKSGKVPVMSFCVEQGRWRQRGGEAVARFNGSPNRLPSKDAKIAVNAAGQGRAMGGVRAVQGLVWKDVARKQMLLSRALGKSVNSTQSTSSLQLTLEDKKLLQTVEAAMKKLSPLLDGQKDVIGFAFAINGQVNSADIYASGDLFKKLWPKLLPATVVEAISELQKGKKFEHPGANAIKDFMLEVEKARESGKDISKRVRVITQETKKNVLFVTRDQANKGIALHKNYIAK